MAYYLVKRQGPRIVARPLFFGAFYGVFLYFFMQHVVLPLSAVPGNQGPTPLLVFWTGVAVHVFFVGVPAAWFARAAHRAGDSPH